MTRKPCTPILTLALLFSLPGTFVLAQTPAPAAAPAPAATAPASPPRPRMQRPGMQPGGGYQGGGQFGPPEMRRDGMQTHRRGRSSFRRTAGGMGRHGGPGGFPRMGDPRGGMMGGFHIGPPGMWWKNTGMVQRLTLTPEQTKKMDDIFQASRLELIDKKANVEKASAILEPMLSANPVDTAKAMAQIDKVAQARADLEKADAKMLLGIRGVLTPEQWTKLHTSPAPPAGGPQGAADGGPGAPRGPGEAGPGGFGPGGNPRGGYGGGGYGGRGGRGAAAPAGVDMDDTRP